MTNNKRPTTNDRGFTLIELMTAVSIFIIVMTVATGSILNVFDANRKSRSLKTVMNNLNLAVESMSREMRYGYRYHCGSGDILSPQSCPSGGVLMSFATSTNSQITYRFNNGSIEKQINDGEYIPVTAPEIIIDDMVFYTIGAETSDALQPKVIVKIRSHAGTRAGRTDFTLQTLISQRVLDRSI